LILVVSLNPKSATLIVFKSFKSAKFCYSELRIYLQIRILSGFKSLCTKFFE